MDARERETTQKKAGKILLYLQDKTAVFTDKLSKTSFWLGLCDKKLT